MTVRSITLLLLAFPSAGVFADDEPPDYAADVHPILRTYCVGCHGADEANGEFRLDDFALLRKGGENGPAVVPGEPDASPLIRLIEATDDTRMPPEDNERPTKQEVAVLRAWIAAGAERGTGIVDPFALVTPEVKPTGRVREPVHDVARHPMRSLLALARYGRVELVDAKTRDVRRRLEEPAGNVNDVRFSTDGRRLIAAAGEPGLYGQVVIWNLDAANDEPPTIVTGHGDALLAATLSPDGRLLATACYDKEIKLWDAVTGEEVRTLTGHNGPVFDLAFHPEGRLLASASGDRTIKLWDVASGKRLDTLGQPEKEQYTVTFSPDGRHVVAAGVDNRIRVWAITKGGAEGTNPLRIARFAHDAAIVELAFSDDGSRLASSAEDRTVKLWDGRRFTPLRTLPGQSDWATGLAFSADATRLWIARMDGSLDASDVGDLDAPKGDRFEDTREPYDVDPKSIAELNEAGQGTGVLAEPGEADYFRFTARAGDVRIVETNAARKKWPTDTRVEVLTADGRPILRTLLRATRDSWINFRPIDSSTVDVRVENWEEMGLNEYLYIGGEVSKIFRMPEGPDSGFNFYKVNGKRRNYFDTSATIHAMDDPVYVVVPRPPDARIVDNGLPVLPVYYENDDDAWRRLGNDSRIRFTAPADGEYLVRVTDVRGLGGEEFKYELAVREPAPDFGVSIGGKGATLNAGSGKRLTLTANRVDDFEGPIEITIENVPEGFSVASPVVIEAGHVEAQGVIHAAADAKTPPKERWDEVEVTARAFVDGNEVVKSLGNLGEIKVAEKPKVLLTLEPDGERGGVDPETGGIVIEPGTRTTAILRIERNGANGPLRFDVDNLPHGVIVADLGLNGITLLPGQTERRIFIQADDWVDESTRLIHAVVRGEGNQASPPIPFHVRQK